MTQLSSFATAGSEEILLPAKPWFVLFTLLCGLVANTLPVSGAALLLKPDFLALVLLYWCIQEPRLIGVGVAWCLGLMMDVVDATVFGQHALAHAVPDIFGGAYCAFRSGSRRPRSRCCCCSVRDWCCWCALPAARRRRAGP